MNDGVIDQDLGNLISACANLDPDKRPTMSQVQAELERLYEKGPEAEPLGKSNKIKEFTQLESTYDLGGSSESVYNKNPW